MTDITRWLEANQLGAYAPLFERNAIGLDVLPELSEADLRELDMPLGDRKRLLRAIRALAPAPPAPATPAPPPVAIAAPQHLSEQILRSRAALEGERKQVTVLFADIKGSTELIADMDAETAAGVLRRAIGEMMAAVHQYEGTVNKVLGDGVMAIFGAPIAHEDHATRACYAALAMQARLRRLSLATRQELGIELQIRQGLNSGDVVVRAINNDLTMDYDAIGPTVHLAGRMEQIAPPGTCRLTLSTYRLAEGYIEVDALGEIPVRGIDDAVQVYELKGAVDFRSRFLASQRGRLTRFVGRDGEITLLEQAWSRAQTGQGQSVAVVGEAGVGKSRLYYEFVHGPSLRGALILESGSVSHARAAAFNPLIDLLKVYFGIGAADDDRRLREKITGKLLTLSESLRQIATPILALLGAVVHDPAWETLEPAQRRRATLDGCRTLLLREAQEQPLVVIFEDLHWIDAETQAFLDLLVGSIVRAPILLLFNYRPEYSDPWIGKSSHSHIRIDPLPPASGEAMLADLLGDAPGLEDLRRLLMARTEGYPFFIEETVQGLVEEGALAGERGAYRLTVPVQRITVPPTIQSVLGARIDRLPPDAKRLLQTASVIGKDFELSLLREVAELPESAVQDHLATLQAGEFIYETRLFPDPEYTFKHALTHQVSYETLLKDRRREKHAEILAAIERLHGDRLSERLERLVHHALRGQAWEAVHRYGLAAGHRAIELNANRSAVEAFEHVAAALAHLPETPERLRDAIECRFDLRDVLFVLGEPERIPALLDEAEELAHRLDDRSRLISALLYRSGYHWSLGYHGPATESALRARDLAEAEGDRRLLGLACYRLTTACTLQGDYEGGLRWAEPGLAALEPEAATLYRFGGLVHTFVGSFAALCYAELGRFERAVAVGRAAFDLGLRSNHAYSITVSGFGISHAHLLRGNVDAALPILEEGLRQIEIHGVAAAAPWVTSRAAYAFATAGRLQEMEAMIEAAIGAEAMELAPSMRHDFALIWSARACLVGRQHERAVGLARRALDSGDPQRDRDSGVDAWAAWVTGEALRGDGDGAAAAAAYGTAIDAAQRQGMLPLLAHGMAGRAALAGDAGDAAEARRLAAEMGMSRLVAEIDALGL